MIRNYNDFKTEVINTLTGKIGSIYDVSVKPIIRNNDTKYEGLIMMMKSSKCDACPVINLDFYYERLDNGEEFTKLIDEMIRVIRTHKLPIAYEDLIDWDIVKDKICCGITNAQKSNKLLEKLPHILIYDLAIYFYIRISPEAIIKINNEIKDKWNVSVDDLMEIAKSNMQLLTPPTLLSMMDTLKAMLGMPEGIADLLIPDEDQCMYVLSNKSNMFGAVSFIISDKVQELSERLEKDVYILPSSIHEVILVPTSDTMSAFSLKCMVSEVNGSQVPIEEQLSDSIYHYNRYSRQISMC